MLGTAAKGVVERADSSFVEIDVSAGDRIDNADIAEPRRSRREEDFADHGQGRREQERRANEGYAAGRLGRAAQRRFNEVLKPSELTPRHLQVLDELREGL
jgi:hypothetical protein